MLVLFHRGESSGNLKISTHQLIPEFIKLTLIKILNVKK